MGGRERNPGRWECNKREEKEEILNLLGLFRKAPLVIGSAGKSPTQHSTAHAEKAREKSVGLIVGRQPRITGKAQPRSGYERATIKRRVEKKRERERE